MKRNLAFWIRYTWDSFSATLAGVAVFALLLAVGSSGKEWLLLVSALPYLLVVVSMMMLVILHISGYILYVPLLISMGETRRNVFCGYQFYRLLVIGVTVACCGAIWLLVPGEAAAAGLQSLPVLTIMLVIASALGGIMGVLHEKCKWLSGIVLMAVGMCAGILGALMGLDGEGFLLGDLNRLGGFLQRTPLWLVLLAVVLLAADTVLQWCVLRHRAVRF